MGDSGDKDMSADANDQPDPLTDGGGEPERRRHEVEDILDFRGDENSEAAGRVLKELRNPESRTSEFLAGLRHRSRNALALGAPRALLAPWVLTAFLTVLALTQVIAVAALAWFAF